MITQLLQIALGSRERLSHTLSEKEWWTLYQQACKQAVAGVCFAGIEKLPKEQWPPQALLYEWINEKEGRFVLSEIMQTGNFGQGDTRYKYKRWFKLPHHIAHGGHLLAHYPSEVIWTPIWLIYHKMWKWNKKRKIRLIR